MSREWKGDAVVTTLTAGISSGDLGAAIAAATNWPVGSGSDQFVIMISSTDGSVREKILVEERGGTGLIFAAGGRGFDGTSPQSFITGDIVAVVFDAVWFQSVDDHLNDIGRDDHTQYLTDARHDALAHEFGTALATPGAPESVGTNPNAGTSGAPARADHVHDLAAGSVNAASILTANVVTATKIADNAVIPGKIESSLAGFGLSMGLGVFHVNTDGVTCHINGSNQLEILGGVVSTGGIADNAITLAKMADASVGMAEIIDANVTTAKLADDSVVTLKLLDANVTRAKLAPNIAKGHFNFDDKTTSQAGITGETLISGLSVSMTPTSATRHCLIHVVAQAISGTTGDEKFQIRAKRSGTTIGQRFGIVGNSVDYWFVDDSPPAGANAYTVSLQKLSGTGTVSFDASVTQPAQIETYDLGGA